MNNNLTLSVTLTGDHRQLSGTLKDAQGDVRAFSTTTAQESQKAKTALAAPGREAGSVSEHLRTAGQDARTFGTETAQGGRQANQALTQAADQAQTATGRLDQLKGVAVGLGAAFVTMGVREFAGDVYETVSSAQKLQASLETVTGDIDSASAAWDQMREFAKTTPFALEQSIQGFIRMKSLGLDPTEDTMRSFANTAAAMNTDLMQMVEAVADATTGEFERLKEYGIKARKEGDQIALTFQGVTTRVQNSAEDIQSYLTAIGNTTFADAAIGQMDTLGGKANNLQDEMRDLHLAIGEAGATELFERGLNVASGAVEALTDNIDVLAKSTTIITTAGGAYVAYRGILVGVTAAQWAFNAAVRANPLGLLITLAGAAAGAMIAFGNDADKAAGRAERAANSVLGLTGEVENLTAAQIENRKVPLISAAFEAEREADSIRRLTAEYNEWIKAQTGTITFIPERFMGIGRDGGAVARLKDHQKAAELARGELAELEQVQASLGETTKNTGDAVDTGTRTLIEGTEASQDAAKAAAKQADELESLRNRMNPARRETIQYARDMNTLTTAFAAGRVGAGEFLALQGDIATRLATLGDTSTDAVETINDNTDAMGVLWENTLERMDDAGVDMWRSFLDGSEDAFSSFKRLAINTLAEVIHQYTTRQITASFGINAQGGGMGAGGGMGGGLSLDSISPDMLSKGWDTVSGWFGGGGANAAAQSYAGSGWASSATSGGGWYGSATSSGANGGAAAGGWQSGLVNMGYAYAGGYLGTEIGEAAFGKTANSNYGQAIGTAVGTYFLPGIGTAVGAFLGSAVDTLFGSNEKTFDFDFAQGGNYGVFGDRESALGQFGITDFSDYKRGEQQGALDDMLNALVEFDNTLARVALPERFEQLKESVEGFEYGDPEGLAGARTRAIVEGSGAIGESHLLGIEDDQALAEAFLSSLQLESTIAGMGEAVAADINAEIERVVTEGGKAQHAISSMQQAAGALRLLDNGTDRLNLTFDATASGAIHAASGLQDMLGGVENLAAMQSSYYSNYFSETEKAAHAFSDVYDALSQVTDKVPETKREFRELVEAQNLNTEAGREAYAQLLQLAPAFAQVGGSLEDVFSTIYQDVLGREPDDGGIAHWIEQVESGAVSLSEALEQISGSAEAAQSSSEAAAVSITDMSQAVSARQSLERELLRAQGDTEALRQMELGSLRELEGAEQQGLVTLQERIWALADAAEADKKAAQAAREKAQAERAVAQERRGLKSQLLQAQGDTEALRQLELASLDESNRALQERIWTIQDEMAAAEKSAQAEREAISKSMDIIGRIQSARENQLNAELGAIRTLSQLYDSLQLSSQSILDPLERMNEAQRQFAQLQVRAENGDTAAVGELQGASTAYLDAVAAYYGQSSEQYARVFNDVNTSVEDLGDEFESSVSELNRVGRKIDDAAAGVDANHSESLSALQGIIDGLDWLPEGIGAEINRIMNGSTASGGSGGSNSGGSSGSSESSGGAGAPPIGGNLGQNTDPYDPVSAKERAIIKFLDVSSKGSIEGSGILDGMWNLTLGGVTAPFSEGGLLDSYRAAYALEGDSSLPKFANGGQHGGGWRMVGERGPEIEWTPPSRIYSNADSRQMLGVGVSGAVDLEPLTRELQALRQEVAQLRAERHRDAERAAGQRDEQMREQRRGNRQNRRKVATV